MKTGTAFFHGREFDAPQGPALGSACFSTSEAQLNLDNDAQRVAVGELGQHRAIAFACGEKWTERIT